MMTFDEVHEQFIKIGNKREPSYFKKIILKEIEMYNLNYEFIGFNINSIIEFKGARTKLVLKCPVHGIFSDCTFNNFTKSNAQGRRCPECAKESKALKQRCCTEEFIEKCKRVHNDFYDYSKTIYGKNAHEHVVVTCKLPNHGDFKIRPSCHYNKAQGCPICAKEKRKIDEQDIITRLNEIHNNHFGFDKFVYNGSENKSIVTCLVHNKNYEVKVGSLLYDHGCAMCSTRAKHTKESFISMAVLKHGNVYDYSKVQYVDLFTKVEVVCNKDNHGSFFITPTSHIHGLKPNACPKCSKYGFQPNKPGFFYIQKITNSCKEVISYKYGITCDLIRRLNEHNRNSIYVHEYIFHEYFDNGYEAIELEKLIKKSIPSWYLNSNEFGDGFTETYDPKYHKDVINIIKKQQRINP